MASHNDLEVEADRKAAEDSGCSVTLRSNFSHQDRSYETQRSNEEDTRGRGRGQAWGRRRMRGPRTRPRGHFSQGTPRDNHITELESSPNSNPDKFLSAGFDPSSDKISSSFDSDAGQQLESSFSQNSSHPQYSSQESRENSRGQRSAGYRGGSRPKYVTVPDASHSHDVRHVEHVNDSIVINIDLSTRPSSEPSRRGRGGRSAGRGAPGKGNVSALTAEDGADFQSSDREVGFVHGDSPPQRSGYRGRAGRRPFRGSSDGSYRGHGRGEGGFRRGRYDGPRPFRSGYRGGDRARGGRGPRRTVIQVVTPSGNGVEERSSHAQGGGNEEDWDKEAASAEAGATGTSGSDEHAWPGGEDGATILQEEHQNADDLEDDGSGNYYDEPLTPGVYDNEDGAEQEHGQDHDEAKANDGGAVMEKPSDWKENGKLDLKVAESKELISTEVKESLSESGSLDVLAEAGIKSESNVEEKPVDTKQESAVDIESVAKINDGTSSDLPETVKDDASKKNVGLNSTEATNTLIGTTPEKPIAVQPTNATESNSVSPLNQSKDVTSSSAADSNSSVVEGSKFELNDSSALSSDVISEKSAPVDQNT